MCDDNDDDHAVHLNALALAIQVECAAIAIAADAANAANDDYCS